LIEDRVNIGGFGMISAAETIIIENDVTIGPRVFITDHQHAFRNPDVPIGAQGIDRIASVRVCNGAWIGVGVTILQGVMIGKNAIVGANSVVTKSVPDGVVVCGVPAQIVRHRS
jgi:acetyltransferase-like isoleucine patch superfamily enzyme